MAPEQSSSRSVLIIDDDLLIRGALTQILEDEGYCVASAANGQEGINYLRSTPPPTLILLDLMMPVMNGWQFRSEQRRDPVMADIPVIVLSGDGGIQQKATSLGIADYLQKPVDLETLLETVERHCGI